GRAGAAAAEALARGHELVAIDRRGGVAVGVNRVDAAHWRRVYVGRVLNPSPPPQAAAFAAVDGLRTRPTSPFAVRWPLGKENRHEIARDPFRSVFQRCR